MTADIQESGVQRTARVTFTLDSDRIFRTIAICAAIVFGLGVFRQVVVAIVNADTDSFGWDFINLDRERNLPAWFSSLLLFSGAMTAAFVARFAAKHGERPVVGWWALAVIFTYMSLDEMAALHEQTSQYFQFARPWSSAFNFAWVVGAVPLVTVIGALFIPFLLRLRHSTATRLVVAGAIYLFGALGMEMIAGPVIQWRGRGDFYAICFMIEEGCELAGAILFLRALLYHIAEGTDRLIFAVRRPVTL